MTSKGKGGFTVEKGLLYHTEHIACVGRKVTQLCLPALRRKTVLELAHSTIGCHQAYKRTRDRICLSFYWPLLSSECRNFAANGRFGRYRMGSYSYNGCIASTICISATRELSVYLDGLRLRHECHPTYLEVTLESLDRTLSYREHLTKTAGKLQKKNRNNLLMKLAGSTWGASANTLRSSALVLCYSAAEY